MSFYKMLSDRTDIYKLKISTGQTEYGVPAEESYYYDNVADYENVKCSVQSSGWKSQVVQSEPHTEVMETLKAIYPPNTDVSLNDKIIFNGVEYKAKVPRNIRNHHTEVEIERIV